MILSIDPNLSESEIELVFKTFDADNNEQISFS